MCILVILSKQIALKGRSAVRLSLWSDLTFNFNIQNLEPLNGSQPIGGPNHRLEHGPTS